MSEGARAEERVMLAACCAALATLGPVALHQLGVLDHLPDPPGEIFDSARITESAMAHPLGVPDSLLGMASYGTTLTLILMARRSEAARRVLGAKLALDGAVAGFNVVRQVTRFGKLCSWCTGTAIATAVMVYAGRGRIAESARAAASVGSVLALEADELLSSER